VAVSAPFCTLSVHDGAWHVALQTPSLQSVPALQLFPSSHAGQLTPPQSTSVSLPLSIPSVHVGAGGGPPSSTLASLCATAPSCSPLSPPLSLLSLLSPPLLPSTLFALSALSVLPPSLALPIAVVSPLVEHAATHPTTAQHESSSRHALPIDTKYLDGAQAALPPFE
jgi:hypothetical protein